MGDRGAGSAEQTPASRPIWGLEEGEEIAPGLSALLPLGGGRRYEVYLAFSERHWTTCVVKLLRPDRVDDRAALEGLTREAGILDSVAHPVLVRSFGAELSGDRPHLILEHLEGPNLADLLDRYGPLAAEQLLPLGLELAAALHFLGSEGIVHLDVKPGNVIMGAPPRLIDLSLARTIEQGARLSRPVGTRKYMAPEQCQPGELGPVGAPADVWGLGATLYEAIAGVAPFEPGAEDTAPPEERWPQLRDEPAPLEGIVPPLAEPILASLEFEPAERPTARELAEALEPLIDSLPKRRRSRA